MTTRKTGLECKIFQRPETQWHHLECKLITPMYGGGVESATIDQDMPIRASSIRGQLRFWWRFLAKNVWMKDKPDEDIQKAEFALWGGMGAKTPIASQVFIKIEFPEYRDEIGKVKNFILKGHRDYYKDKSYGALAYVLFPADKDENNGNRNCPLLQEGFSWRLSIKFEADLAEYLKDEVIETLRWWSQFGGVGARTRRGTGAFIADTEDSRLAKILKPISIDEASKAGCSLVLKNSQPNAISAWNASIAKLKDFRQGRNIGRNEGKPTNRPGRSRWPEPDAIRRIQKQNDPNHKPIHEAGNIFPRGLFGMPIIFDFGRKNHQEPNTTTLQPKDKERMISPLILRPYYDRAGQGYAPMALLLPHLLSLKVDLKVDLKGSKATDGVILWKEGKAESIAPIKENSGTNPLDAFMNFFQKG